MNNFLICPFCLTIFVYGNLEEEECPECGVGDLESLEFYLLKVNSSFMEYISKERNIDEQ